MDTPGADTSLTGTKIVVTRSRAQAGKLAKALEARHATAIEFPTIEIHLPKETPHVDLTTPYDWVIFTSVNAVRHFGSVLHKLNTSLPMLPTRHICAVGPATKEALEQQGLEVDFIPSEFIAESVFAALKKTVGTLKGTRILIPHGNLARDLLLRMLREEGAIVTECVVYCTAVPEVSPEEIDALLSEQPDWITFTSASTARNFCEILGPSRLQRIQEFSRFASIGPKTTAAAKECGLEIHVEPKQHDIAGLVEALELFLA